MSFTVVAAWSLLAAAAFADDSIHIEKLEALATRTGATVNKAPEWARHGAFVYRIATPDNAGVLPFLEQGLALTNHLLDGSIEQIPIINGVIGHDHLGSNNWDGLWPYWGRVTFRAGNWKALDDFMRRVKNEDNTSVSFHVNLTDVNAGLRDYPETRAFFQKLVDTKSIYWRGRRGNRTSEAYIPRKIPDSATAAAETIANINYKTFWDSGLAKETIDGLYSHLPYAPPILYLDVLCLSDDNTGSGLPDGPLGGSEQTQLEGILNIASYVNGKGTSVATEGDRRFLIGRGATYGWLHCNPGYSSNDYSYIAGASRYVPVQHVAGNTGCFDVAPIGATAGGLARVRDHYARLLAGMRDPKPTPGLDTCHIAYPISTNSNEFDIPGTGDELRGDWADNIDNFYLTGIQELYHIGKGNVRTAIFNKWGMVWISRFGLVDEAGREFEIKAVDCAPPDLPKAAREAGHFMIQEPLEAHFLAPRAGKYRLILYGAIRGNEHGALNIYVNGELGQSALDIHFPRSESWEQPADLGEISLRAGDNRLAFDAGPIFMRWSDGTTAVWTTPYLCKGFKVTNGDVTYADDYDRMWPDSWSGQRKIYFFSWDGTDRAWKLPPEWLSVTNATLYPLTPDGRGAGVSLTVKQGSVSPRLIPRIPFVLVPAAT